MKKVLMIILVLFSIFLVSCSTVSDEQLEQGLDQLSDEDLTIVTEKSAGAESGALAGQATTVSKALTIQDVLERPPEEIRTVSISRASRFAEDLLLQRELSRKDVYANLLQRYINHMQPLGYKVTVSNFRKALFISPVFTRDSLLKAPLERAAITGVDDLNFRNLVNKVIQGFDVNKYSWWIIHQNWRNEVAFASLFQEQPILPSALEEYFKTELPGLDLEDSGAFDLQGIPLPPDFLACIAANGKKAQPEGGVVSGGGDPATTTGEEGTSGGEEAGMATGGLGSGQTEASEDACYALAARPSASAVPYDKNTDYSTKPASEWPSKCPYCGSGGVSQSEKSLKVIPQGAFEIDQPQKATFNLGEDIKIDMVQPKDSSNFYPAEAVPADGCVHVDCSKAKGVKEEVKNAVSEQSKVYSVLKKALEAESKPEDSSEGEEESSEEPTSSGGSPIGFNPEGDYEGNGCNDVGLIIGCFDFSTGFEDDPECAQWKQQMTFATVDPDAKSPCDDKNTAEGMMIYSGGFTDPTPE